MRCQKEVLIELGLETDDGTAFQRVRSEGQTKLIVERLTGRTLDKSEIVNAAGGGKAFRISTA